MMLELHVIDWTAVAPITTGLMTIVTTIAVFAAFRANKQAKIANRIAQESLNELKKQREMQQQKNHVEEKRWITEQQINMSILESTGEQSFDNFYHEEYPELVDEQYDEEVGGSHESKKTVAR